MASSALSLDAMRGLASSPATASAFLAGPKRSSVRIPPRNPNPASLVAPLGSRSRSRSCIHSFPLFCIVGQQKQQQEEKQQPQQLDSSFGVVGTVTTITWKELVMESDIPVVVDFWAPWCGPCRMIEPLLDELAKQYTGKIKCLKLNTDECPQIATEYGIRSIPTLMVFVQGQKRETVIGAVPKQTLITKLEKFLT